MPDNEADTIPMPVSEQAANASLDVRRRWEWFKMRVRLAQKWWLRAHTPYQPLFVIATWRSGSNLLLSFLKQQPEVAMLSEVLCSRLAIGPSHDHLSAKQAIGHIRFCLQGERTPIRGCKLMLPHLSNCNLSLDELDAAFPKAKYIVLYRQSLAEQYVSLQVAQATRQFRLGEGEQQQRIRIQVDAGELRHYCDDMRRRYHTTVHHPSLQGKAVLLSYEELTAEPHYWLERQICPLLKVPFVAPETRVRKQNTRSLAEQVTNYSEVAALLRSPLCQHKYQWPVQQPRRRAA